MADISTLNAYADRMRGIGPAPVWQITPPKDEHLAVLGAEHDRMADQGADPSTPTLGYPLTNHGNSTIPNPKLVVVYLGKFWWDTTRFEQFCREIMAYGYLAPLQAYGSGNGTFLAGFQGPAVSGTVTDQDCMNLLTGMIANPPAGFPAPDGHTLYSLVLPDGASSTMGGSASCTGYCGYHGALDAHTFYAVHPSTTCTTCFMSGQRPEDGLTMVVGHEIAEACSDAVPGQGWVNDQTGMENADEWAWVPGSYGPWTIQGYQVNGVGNSLKVIQYTPTQQPGPPPSNTRAIDDAALVGCVASLQAAANDRTNSAYHRSLYRYGATAVGWAQGEMDKVAP